MTVAVQQISKKVCLLGDMSVGKTSLIRRYVEDRFDDKYLSTLGVKVSRKVVEIESSESHIQLTMMLWDIAGGIHNDLAPVTLSYLRGAAGALLICDLTRPDTLQNLTSYVRQLRAVAPTSALLVAANKADLNDQHQITPEEVAQVAQTLNTTSVLTSARTGDGVEELFLMLGRRLVATPSEA